MGAFTTTYGSIDPRIGVKAVAKLLAVGQPLLITQRFAQVDDISTRSGNTVKWRRYHAFTVSSAPLAEGVPPSVQPLLKTDYTAVMQQYGAVTELTDVCVDLHEDNPLDVCVTRSGEQLAQTIEQVTIDMLKAGTNVYWSGTASSRATVTAAPSRADFRLIERGFDRNDGKEITKIVSPTAMVSTTGILPAFVAMAHTDLIPDLKACTGFISFVEYGSPGSALPGEQGIISRHRVITSRMFSPWLAGGTATTTMLNNGTKPGSSLACDVYPVICVARDAYGVVRLQGMKAAEIKVRQPGELDSAQPLGQKGTVGWKTYYACAILNENWIARLECACTATPT